MSQDIPDSPHLRSGSGCCGFRRGRPGLTTPRWSAHVWQPGSRSAQDPGRQSCQGARWHVSLDRAGIVAEIEERVTVVPTDEPGAVREESHRVGRVDGAGTVTVVLDDETAKADSGERCQPLLRWLLLQSGAVGRM